MDGFFRRQCALGPVLVSNVTAGADAVSTIGRFAGGVGRVGLGLGISGATVEAFSGKVGETNWGAGDVFSWEMSSSTGIRVGSGVSIGSTLRDWGVMGVVTLRGGAGIVSSSIDGFGTGRRPVMSSERIFKVVT